MPIGAVASTTQGTVHQITPQAQQPAAAPNSQNLQGTTSLVFKPVDESHKSSKTRNRHDPDNHLSDTEEGEWLQKKYKREQRLGLNVDKYV